MGDSGRGVRKKAETAKKAGRVKRTKRGTKKKAEKEGEAKPRVPVEEKPVVLTGRLLGYRWGIRRQRVREGLLSVGGCDSAEDARELVGRIVLLRYPKGKVVTGKVIGIHGSKGVLRARFRKGLAGDAVGLRVRIA